MHVGGGICKRDVRVALLSDPHHFSPRVTGKPHGDSGTCCAKAKLQASRQLDSHRQKKTAYRWGTWVIFHPMLLFFGMQVHRREGNAEGKFLVGVNQRLEKTKRMMICKNEGAVPADNCLLD